MPRRKLIILTVAQVDADYERLLEQERDRMSRPRPARSQLPPPPRASRQRDDIEEPRPVRRVTPSK
jgi:hypothetical protein